MRWSMRIARVGGTEIRMHLTFVALVLLIAFGYGAESGAVAALAAVGFILLLFASIVLHEMGHALAARRFGIQVKEITLLPIGGVARLPRLPPEPRKELVIALAGPAVTLAIILALLLVRTAMGVGAWAFDPRSLPAQLLAANVVLLGFNLLPAFPMDGGRVLRATLALRMDYVRATRVAAAAGQAFAVAFGLLGLMVNPLLVLVGIFVFFGARMEAAAAELQHLAGRFSVGAAMQTEFRALAPEATLGDAADALLAGTQHDFPVVDASGGVRGVLTRARLLEALAQRGRTAPVESSMQETGAAVAASTPLEVALQRLEESTIPVLPVSGEDGRLIGLLTRDNLAEMLLVQGALASRGGPRDVPSPPASREG